MWREAAISATMLRSAYYLRAWRDVQVVCELRPGSHTHFDYSFKYSAPWKREKVTRGWQLCTWAAYRSVSCTVCLESGSNRGVEGWRGVRWHAGEGEWAKSYGSWQLLSETGAQEMRHAAWEVSVTMCWFLSLHISLLFLLLFRCLLSPVYVSWRTRLLLWSV